MKFSTFLSILSVLALVVLGCIATYAVYSTHEESILTLAVMSFAGIGLTSFVAFDVIYRYWRREYRPTEEERFFDTHDYCIEEIKNNLSEDAKYQVKEKGWVGWSIDWVDKGRPFSTYEEAKQAIEVLRRNDGDFVTTRIIE